MSCVSLMPRAVIFTSKPETPSVVRGQEFLIGQINTHTLASNRATIGRWIVTGLFMFLTLFVPMFVIVSMLMTGLGELFDVIDDVPNLRL